MDKCKNCKHYNLRKMIQVPYYYGGDIPCLTCSRYVEYEDKFEPAQKNKEE